MVWLICMAGCPKPFLAHSLMVPTSSGLVRQGRQQISRRLFPHFGHTHSKSTAQLKKRTECDVADVVSHGGVGVLELQGGLSVTEQHLGGGVAGTPAFLKLLQRHKQMSENTTAGKHQEEEQKGLNDKRRMASKTDKVNKGATFYRTARNVENYYSDH